MPRRIHQKPRFSDRGYQHGVFLTRWKSNGVAVYIRKDYFGAIGLSSNNRVALFTDTASLPRFVGIRRVTYGGSRFVATERRGYAFFPLSGEKLEQLFPDGERFYTPGRINMEDNRILWFELPPGRSACGFDGFFPTSRRGTSSDSLFGSTVLVSIEHSDFAHVIQTSYQAGLGELSIDLPKDPAPDQSSPVHGNP